MRIVQLHAENFKRLGVVEITPEGNLVTIGGKNGHGKSSVLDAIYVALKGRAVAPPRPIRQGEEQCTIRLDLGDWIITRKFHAKEGGEFTDSLKIENPDGLRQTKNPQQMLDSLLGEIGFDPFEFVNLKPKEQAARLLQMVPLAIDLDEFAAADASDFANRRDINREVARLRAQVEAIPKEEIPADLPDRAALADQLGNAADTNAQINADRQRREASAREAMNARDQAAAARARAETLRAEAAKLDAAATEYDESAKGIDESLAALPPLPDYVDTDAIRAKLRDADTLQAAVERQKRRADLAAELAKAEAQSEALTEAMAERARQRNAALAEAEMPVPGLAFAIAEDGSATLTYEGLPFDRDQISTAAQLRVSTAIGMAANPTLRVLRIMDGSLLDEDSMRLLAEMAEAEDFQLWVEVVGTGGVGIIMENGEIRPAPEADGNQDDSTPPAPDAPDGMLV